ncbi:MAG: EamA family transporter [Chloroflexi bacterium]|nr:EamA family transporter [Chloroflexota bacterium]
MITTITPNVVPSRTRGIALVILATVFWSTSGIFINLIIQQSGVSSVNLAFWRDLGTFLVLLVGIALLNPQLLRIKRHDIPWLFAMGGSIGAFHALWNTAVVLNGASIATVIQSDSPIFVTIMAWIFFKEPLTRKKFAAIALSIAGTVLISGFYGMGSLQVTGYGVTIALASAIMYGLVSLFGKKLVGNYSSWTVLLYTFGIAALLLLPLQFATPIPWPISTQVQFLFAGLVLITTVSGFALYTTALKALQASVASIMNTTEVAFAAILAYFILGERLDIWQIIGAALVVSGVILISLPNGKTKNT